MFFAVKIVMIAGCILLSPRAVMADRTPTDIELRTAYCKTLIETSSNQLHQQIDRVLEGTKSTPSLEKNRQDFLIIQRKSREEDERLLRRFDLYLLPRLHDIDPLQVLIALKRGEEDGNRLFSEAMGCGDGCQGVPASNYKSCSEACFKDKGLYAIRDQLKLCQAPTWLPF